MSLQLLVLCLAAFGLVASAVSGLVNLSLPLFDRVALSLRTRQRAFLWFGLGALPTAIGALTIVASFFPAWGLAHDHCLSHGLHHPHLCPDHVGQAPGLVVLSIAAFVGFRLTSSVFELARTFLLSRSTANSLAQGSTWDGENFVFESETPDAFVFGFFSPRVFVSRALLALGSETSECVLAHERVHAQRRDSLIRVAATLLCLGHLPHIAEQIRTRLIAAQELTADEEGAASIVDGRVKMASAILTLARTRQLHAPALAFTDGDIRTRVAVLLEPPRQVHGFTARVLTVAAVALPLVVGFLHESIHHELETLLGILS